VLGVRHRPPAAPRSAVRRRLGRSAMAWVMHAFWRMSYIDGFVVPVPVGKKQAYRDMATKTATMFKELGATQVVECWGDDVPKGKVTDFQGAVKAEAGENVVFSWVVWPSKEVRDQGNKKMMEDPRMKAMADLPFDGKRMIFGGFEVMIDTAGKTSR
jgi:uncharacterized protein YbaA (DUF1428 family)